MILQHLYECIFPRYEQLYDAYSKVFDPKKYVVFLPQVGNAYPEAEHEGILFVGRATNGWRNHLDEPLKGQEGVLEEGGVFGWQYNRSLQELNLGTPFLSLLRKIAYRHCYNTDPNNYFQHIAWSNLYKVAPDLNKFPGRKNLNPDDSERLAQFEICDAILKEEIEILSPKYVVFITGWDWVKDFSQGKTMPTDTGLVTTENWIPKKNRQPLAEIGRAHV